ncbi:hypothetical protein BDW68DRAFT_105956 [Aspergillus falconensis]
MASNYTVRQIPAVLRKSQHRVVACTLRRLASTSAPQTHNPAYPLYPSVISLLHQKGIPEAEVSKIPASGPKGRLLKGDVLAYLGLIPSDYPASQASRIEKLAHLDLSNIKIAPPAPAAPAAPEPAPAAERPVAKAPPTTSVVVSISLSTVLRAQRKLQKSVGVTIPLSTFVARAADLANDDLPRSPYAKQSADEIFEELLGAEPVKVSRGQYIPELNAVDIPPEVQPAQTVKEDLIDFLSGSKTVKRTSPAAAIESLEPEQALNVFSLTVPVGEEKRARTFLERVKTLLTIEPARLVI